MALTVIACSDVERRADVLPISNVLPIPEVLPLPDRVGCTLSTIRSLLNSERQETEEMMEQHVAMDTLGRLPETENKNKYILVVGELFTKWMEALQMPNMEAATVARLFVSEFVCRYAAPEILHTDQGRNSESTLMK